jgi:hypothetical protein
MNFQTDNWLQLHIQAYFRAILLGKNGINPGDNQVY